MSKLLKRRFDIERRMLQNAEEIEKAHEAAQREFDVALEGRVEALQVGPLSRAEIAVQS